VPEEFIEVATLERRLREAILTAHSQVAGPPQICAWARTCFLKD